GEDREDLRLTLADPALDDGVARARRHDRVYALADVVDLVRHVRADVEADPADERDEEERPVEEAGEGGDRPTRCDRDGGRRERERPGDLVPRTDAIASALRQRLLLRGEGNALGRRADLDGAVEERRFQHGVG